MPANFPIPADDRVRDVLGDLMGRSVSVTRVPGLELDLGRPAAIADYELDTGKVGVLCVADIRLANALGAALTMVAPGAVDDAIANLTLEDSTIDNLREVVNVMTSLFNTNDTPHVKFRDVRRLPSQLPAETAQLLGSPRARRDFDITVESYGTGTLSVLVG